MGHMGVLQGHRVTGLCVAMGLDGVSNHSDRVRLDGRVRWGDMELRVTWVVWLGEVGAGIPELWGQMELGRCVMGAGRVRESQGHVGV